LRRPPAAASSVLERQDNRPRLVQHPHSFTSASMSDPVTPRIASDYPVTYWADAQLMTSGLKNMGNTCYMNAPIQCLNATVPFARFFLGERQFVYCQTLMCAWLNNEPAIRWARWSLAECGEFHEPSGYEGEHGAGVCTSPL
jgi:ubiquitin C-terminal hydrolase